MKKWLSILLLFALTLQTFSGWETLAGFALYKSYIAKTICINKDDPAMHCNGKCYLKKELQKDQQQKGHENGTTGNKMEINLFCSTEQFLFFPQTFTLAYTFSPVKTGFYPSPYFNFFHPPKLIGSLI